MPCVRTMPKDPECLLVTRDPSLLDAVSATALALGTTVVVAGERDRRRQHGARAHDERRGRLRLLERHGEGARVGDGPLGPGADLGAGDDFGALGAGHVDGDVAAHGETA